MFIFVHGSRAVRCFSIFGLFWYVENISCCTSQTLLLKEEDSPIMSCLQPDCLAGLSVAALVIPQGMSYAKLAGLPSVYGLYGAFVPVLCYASLGTSRHLVRTAANQQKTNNK